MTMEKRQWHSRMPHERHYYYNVHSVHNLVYPYTVFFVLKRRLLITSTAYIQKHFRIHLPMEANTMDPVNWVTTLYTQKTDFFSGAGFHH